MPTPNNQDPIYSYQPLFGSWYIYEQIGKGTFGTVYKIKRQEKGFYAESAVKIITFPSDEYYRDTQSIIGKNKQDLYEFFSSQLDSITREINILHKLRFHPNIVIYEDHQIIQKEDRLSWDILIRMEYLKSLPSYLDDNSLNMRQAVKLGIDILTALSECNKYNIVHRDIKDSNIFITDRSAFKLGDFGIARELSKSASVASFHGTPSYVSPEVVRQEEYDIRSDIYSLGIVMYRLLNNLRIPFAPKYPDKQHPADITNAVAKRLKGEPLKAPINTVMPLSDIVLKACAYSRNDRYASPDDMIKDLDAALAKIDPKLLDRQVTPGEYTEDISGTDHIFIPDKEEEIKEELTDHVLPLAEEEIPQEQPLPVPSPTSWYKRTWAIATFASVFIVILIVSVVFLVKWNLPEETASEATSEASAAVVETTAETTAAATVENETAAAETTIVTYKESPTTETTQQGQVPTIKLTIIEGPTSAEGGSICYYRVKATVTGNPAPTIIFSKDDSNGSFGSNVAQVNLSQGESYTLTTSASNDIGSVSDNITLEWKSSQGTTSVVETSVSSSGDILYNIVNGIEFRLIHFAYWPDGANDPIIVMPRGSFSLSELLNSGHSKVYSMVYITIKNLTDENYNGLRCYWYVNEYGGVRKIEQIYDSMSMTWVEGGQNTVGYSSTYLNNNKGKQIGFMNHFILLGFGLYKVEIYYYDKLALSGYFNCY
jgi:serine/threonine protein kinase